LNLANQDNSSKHHSTRLTGKLNLFKLLKVQLFHVNLKTLKHLCASKMAIYFQIKSFSSSASIDN
jgi:hypothetical protein